jgi:glucose/mannose-6-phosphate isomerase
MDFDAQIRSLPDQLRWASEYDIPALAATESVLVTGMGGSGITGDFGAVLAAEAGTRLDVVKGYDLPGWAARQRPLVVAVSYSGDTEETLSVAEQAAARGLRVVTISSGGHLADSEAELHIAVPGGNQPRASLGFLLGSLCRVLQAVSVLNEPDLAGAADVAESVYRGQASVDRLVEDMVGKIAIVWAGSPLTAPVAQRWKTQINENAKAPAWWSALPEADHNEIVGWSSLAELTRASVVVVPLVDGADHPRVGTRLALTRRLTTGDVAWTDPVRSTGEAPLARMLSLAAMADVVTLRLAARYQVDPEAVALIETLKRQLEESK